MAYNPNAFFDLARPENRNGSRYIWGSILTVVLWLLIVIIVSVAFVILGFESAIELTAEGRAWKDLTPDQDFDALIACFFILFSLVALLIANLIVVKFIHKQPFLEVFTARPKFDFRRLALSGLLLLVLHGLVLSFGLLTSPEEFILVFDLGRMAPFIVLVLLLAPLQCFAEEVFFRGYLTQGLSIFTGNLIVRLTVPALVFALFHAANGDWSAGGIWATVTYISLAIYLAIITWRSNGLEAATGLHVVNNLMAFLIVTSPSAGMPFATVLVTDTPNYMVGFFSLLPVLALHYLGIRYLGLLVDPKDLAPQAA